MYTPELAEKYPVRWYDDEKTILLCEITTRWTWDDAHQVITYMNDQCGTVSHGVYSLFHFQNNTAMMPTGSSAISNLKKLMATESVNDMLNIFVGGGGFIRMLVDTTGHIYGMRRVVSKLRFVSTLGDALSEVEKHKHTRGLQE